MTNRYWKQSLFVLAIAAILLSSCSFSINLGNPTSTTAPTPAAIVVSTQPSVDTRPTEDPTTSSSTTAGTYKLSSTLLTNPEGAFSLYPPDGWENQAKDSKIKVSYISPDGSVLITTQFTNTGYKLDGAGFENFINGNQDNVYFSETNYTETSREINADKGTGMVYVTFDWNNVPQKAERLYAQDGNVIFEVEFWTDADKWDANVDFFNQYLAGITYYGSKVSNYEPYMFVQTYTGPNDLFSFEYLRPWLYQLNKTNDKYFTSESFYSPDNNAAIDVFYYNDNKTIWSQGDAGGWALTELESVYAKGASDLKIDSDQINENGFEQLNWHTKQNKLVGITVFKAKETEIMLLTTYWLQDYSSYYQSSLEYVITTFSSPAAK
jgi:hypothetical protein